MSYRESGYTGSTLKVGALVGTLLIGTFVAPPIKRYLARSSRMTALANAHSVDTELIADPTVSLVKMRFPKDYARLRAGVMKSAGEGDGAAIGVVVDRTITGIVKRDGAYLTRAPHDDLMRAAGAELAVYQALELQPTLCAGFGTPAFDAASLDDETRGLIASIVRARLAAIAAGRDTPRTATPPESMTAVQQALLQALAGKSIDPQAYEILAGKRTAAQATEATQCQAAIHFLQAVRDMPAADADQIYAPSTRQ